MIVVTPLAVIAFFVGHRITPLLSPWSTMTNRESKLLEIGRSVMRFEGKGFSGVDRIQGWYGWVSIGFILLTGCTSVNVSLDELGHSWPPVPSG